MIKQTIAFLGATLLLTGCANQANMSKPLTHNLDKKEGIYSLRQAKKIDMGELVNALAPYSIIFVGDHHNTKATHQFFEKVLKNMDKEGYTLYLANEWFTPEHDSLLLKYTNDELDEIRLKERRHWDKFTRYSWDLVEPLYKTIKYNGGKLFGMNLSKEKRKKISLKNFKTMSQEEKEFYNNLDLNVSAHQQLVLPFLKHCKQMPQKSKEPCENRMYRVQVAWDTYMAQNVHKIAQKVLKSKKDKLFVFAGAMHVENNLGIPLRFSRLNNTPFITLSNKAIIKDQKLKINIHQADIIFKY